MSRNGEPSTNAAAWVWYHGGSFLGFQKQLQGPTVQDTLTRALAQTGLSATLMPAGRTDRGVHARMQVVSLRLPASLEEEALRSAWNAALGNQLGVAALRRPGPRFHAQWQATGKQYRYRFSYAAPAGWKAHCWDLKSEARLAGKPAPSPERVAQLLDQCVGPRDFFAFHESSSVRKVRTLRTARLTDLGEGVYEIQLEGDSFARYQVRYLAGAVVAVAMGLLSPEQMSAALEAAQPMAGLKAPGSGLVLWEVNYPPQLDPFSREERTSAPGVPDHPAFGKGA